MAGRVLRLITRLNQGGPARQLEALVPGLAARGWRGPVLHGRLPKGEPSAIEALTATGAELIRVPGLARGIDPGADTRALRALQREIRRVRPDVIHTHMGKAGALGRMAGRVSGVPVVHTLHGHHFDRGGLRSVAVRWVERGLGRLGTRLICLSPSQKRDVVERHRVLRDEHVVVIEPGLETARFVDAGTSSETRDVRRLLWVGRLVAVKRPRALLDLAGALPDVTLDIVGTGPLHDEMDQDIRARGLEGRVHLHGAQPDVRPWLRAATLFVLPSEQEGTPLALIEAMLAGCPVVAAAVGGIPDVIEDGVTGTLVPAGNDAALAQGVEALLANPVQRDAQAHAAGKVAARRYGGARLARETGALYDALRAERRLPSRHG